MDKTRKTIIIVLVVVAVVVLAFIVWWLYWREEPVLNTNAVNQTTSNTNNTVVVNAVTNTPASLNANVAMTEELELIRLANLFAERFGSFTSDSDFQNIIDLKHYMTKTMQAWADNYIKQQQAQPYYGNEYLSVVTKAFSTKVTSQTAVKAEVKVTTQRREQGTDINSTQTYNQDIILELVAEGDEWLVDKATWQAVD